MRDKSSTLRFDAPAGLVVFLVALPLCLGIALASGAPLFSGVIAGICGGIVIGFFSGSEISVSGPAAGLTVIVASGIAALGSFQAFGVAVVLAGAVQIVLGLLKLGKVANYVPNSVIKGMLAAIGLVIILKQIPHALGRDDDYEGDLSFLEKAGDNTFTDIIKAVIASNMEAVIISAISIVLLVLWEKPALRKAVPFLKHVPGPLVVVFLGIALNEGFRLFGPPGFYLRAEDGHLVALPVSASFGEFLANFRPPDFSVILSKPVWTTALTIAAVGSIETLLSLEAADKIDPQKRISSPDRELRAQGIGNIASGLLGGLPCTSVVVRTSANVYAGARTRKSAILHGALLLLAALLIPSWLNLVPLASLAAILIVIGYKLTKVSVYQEAFSQGRDQHVPFIVTVVAIVMTDLLTGVICGILTGVFFILKTNQHDALTLVHDGKHYFMRFNKDVSFVNKPELKEKLGQVPDQASLYIDGGRAGYIDKDIYDVIHDFEDAAAFRGIEIEFRHFHGKARPARHQAGPAKGNPEDQDGKPQETPARQ